MSDIPYARTLLEALAEGLDDTDIEPEIAARCIRETILPLLHRRKFTKAPPTSMPVTDEIKEKVRIYHRRHPDASFQYIANIYRINPGRVSEIINGTEYT